MSQRGSIKRRFVNRNSSSLLFLILLLFIYLGSSASSLPGMRFPLLNLRMGKRTQAVSTQSFRPRVAPKFSPSSSSSLLRTRVVTDIDDTVKSSGGVNIFGVNLGGIDTQFKRGEFYPGVFQFALELSKGVNLRKGILPEKVAVLTARAREFKFALALKPKDKLCSAFREAGQKDGLSNWGIGPVYYGSVAEWVFQERKGLRKFVNFEKMLKEDSMCSGGALPKKYILVGDTGEKDEDAGERIISKYPQSISAVFLHVVSNERDRALVKLPQDRVLKGVPIYYFRTYVGAAQKAMQNNLITQDGLRRVINTARADLLKKSGGTGMASSVVKAAPKMWQQRSSQWAELEQDISSAIIAKENKFRMSFKVNRIL